MATIREECHGYGVLLPAGLALSGIYGSPPRSYYRKRADAVKFRDDLAEHGLPKGRVVKVKVVYEWEGE